MQVRKFILPIIFLIALAGFFVYLFFLKPEKSSGDPYTAVPAKTAFLFEINNVSELFEKTRGEGMADELGKLGIILKLKSGIEFIKVLFYGADIPQRPFNGNSILAAAKSTGSGLYDYLYVIRMAEDAKVNPEKLPEAITSGKHNLEKRNFLEQDIYDLSIGDGSKFSYAFKDGIFIGSYAPILVEDALQQMKGSPGLLDDPEFNKVRSIAEKNLDATIYLNFKEIAELLAMYTDPSKQESVLKMANFSAWMGLDLSIMDESVFFSGFSASPPEDDTYFLNDFTDVDSSQAFAGQYIPASTALLMRLDMDELSSWLRKKKAGVIPENTTLKEWMGNELVFGIKEAFDPQFIERTFLLIRLKDELLAWSELDSKADKGEELDYRGFTIRKIEDKNYPLRKLYPVQGDQALYYIQLDEYALFTLSSAQAKSIIDDIKDENTLEKDLEYLAFKENLTSSSQLDIYINMPRAVEIIQSFIKDKYKTAFQNKMDGIQKLNPLTLQISEYKDLFLSSGFLQYNPVVRRRTNQLWKTALDTTIVMGPKQFINHSSKEKELLVQDASNKLYLLSKSGDVLWKKKLDSPINGEIIQVDYYLNRKLQYLFSTSGKIYLIDRNGNEVADFPINLTSQAAGPLAQVDYGDTKEYRMFIGAGNNNLYGFYKTGKPLPGWNPMKNVGKVEFPLTHFSHKGKDYLVFANQDGRVYLCDRRGENRIKPVELNTRLIAPLVLDRSDKEKPLLVTADSSGFVYRISLDGKIDKQYFNWEIKGLQFQCMNVAGNDDPEYITLQNNRLAVFTSKGEFLFDYSFEDIAYPLLLESRWKSGAMNRICVLDRRSSKIMVFRENGMMPEGFPLDGSTDFTVSKLFNDEELVLSTGSGNFVIAYRLEQ